MRDHGSKYENISDFRCENEAEVASLLVGFCRTMELWRRHLNACGRTPMSPRQANPAATPLEAIDYFFEWSLYCLVTVGFITMAGTGGLDAMTLWAMFAALLVRGFFLWKRIPLAISERWTTPLTLAYLVFFAADYFVISRGFLPATVHLAVFAVIVRMFSLRRERDYLTLSILAFLMVLAAAILTVDSRFLLSFALFMLVAVATFVLLEMRLSLGTAELQGPPLNILPDRRLFPFTLARVASTLMFMILAAAAVLFLILPRRSAGYLGGYSFGTDFSSGFSDHVRLGQIGRIQQSSAVVMHVQIDGDRTGRYDLYWRGVALSDFDGHVWSKPRPQLVLQHGSDNDFDIPASDGREPQLTRMDDGERRIHYRVLMEPIGTNVFFLAPKARSVTGNYDLLATDSAGAVYDFDLQHAVSRYEGSSDIWRPAPEKLRNAGHAYPASIAATYLRLRDVDPRVRQLAGQVTASDKTEYEKAAALENYLRTTYQYTLDLPRSVPADPIANFLFERKQGHCEYFASAMAVMLRSLGIPSRVVNGFHSEEFNDLTGNYVVRAKDAHSWVEVYFPGYGWQTFDPTPSGALSNTQGWSRVSLYLDAMASLWREWVVSYDLSHQYVLGQNAVNGTRNLWDLVRAWTRIRYQSILSWGRNMHHRAERSPVRWMLSAIGFSFAFLVLRNLGSIVRSVKEFQLRAHPERSPTQAAAIWYVRMARALERHGMQKPDTLTPREFVARIDRVNLREPVARFTEVYESARFGDCARDAERLSALYQEVESAARQSRD